jgi:hypothetical protein
VADGDTVRSGRWMFGVVGLPLPGLILFLSYRFHEETWAAAAHRLAVSPVSWMALAVFVAYVVGRPSPPTPLVRSAGWVVAGALLCFGALGIDLLPIRWLEIIADVVLVGLGMSFVGDGFRGLFSAGRAPAVSEPA